MARQGDIHTVVFSLVLKMLSVEAHGGIIMLMFFRAAHDGIIIEFEHGGASHHHNRTLRNICFMALVTKPSVQQTRIINTNRHSDLNPKIDDERPHLHSY